MKEMNETMSGYMYILKCSDSSYYVGSTINIERRILQHNSGVGAKYTKGRLPVELMYYEYYENIRDAFIREKQVQGWSRRKREALINETPQLLPELSRKVVSTGSTTKTGSTTATSSSTE